MMKAASISHRLRFLPLLYSNLNLLFKNTGISRMLNSPSTTLGEGQIGMAMPCFVVPLG